MTNYSKLITLKRITLFVKKLAFRVCKKIPFTAKIREERRQYIDSLYQCVLQREANSDEIDGWLDTGYSTPEMLSLFLNSEEYQLKRSGIKNDIIALYKCLLSREPNDNEVDIWINTGYSVSEMLSLFLNSEEYKLVKATREIDESYISGGRLYIVGEDKPLNANTSFEWHRSVAEELVDQQTEKTWLEILNNKEKVIIESSDYPAVAIITSLYKGENYIKAFMINLIQQTIFEQCQLLIIDANSPQNEYEIIKDVINKYHNIKYLRLDKTLGIYETWNLAIKESHSEFITNANVDDLHRHDALELKVKALRENSEIDVVYSDVFYSMLANLSFEIAEKANLKTNLPTANKFNLLNFNSPHNSPMWRRTLHEKIGYFDPSYQSAGDYEFWLRAAFSDIRFMKLSEPLVMYYHNPQGMSTKKKSPGEIEGRKIINTYRSLLQESLLKQS